MNKLAYVLGILLIAGFAVLGVTEMRKAVTPYVETVAQVRAAKGGSVQFMGEVVREKCRYDEKADKLLFQLRDEKGEALDVRFSGVKPANFDTADHVVVTGNLRGGKFEAQEVTTKCPSKYESESR